ncbi:hypothetical protein AB0P37_40570 [Streptomyces antimycoticus]|uniref:hypothetical protein n=1 Tax=Streptomyces antimycoticus TaxID=68175 RepID=UPI003436E2C4
MLTAHYTSSRFGQLHYVECGEGEPVLLLHQTPRSWTEYRDVLPLVGATHRAIAMDTVGYGPRRSPRTIRASRCSRTGSRTWWPGWGWSRSTWSATTPAA